MGQKSFEFNTQEYTSGNTFFASYVGPSMNPTLSEPEIMEIVPYESRPLRVGDVVFFLPLGTEQPIVHRVVRVTRAGISTLGDNNTQRDPSLLQPKDIKGQVKAAWRGQKRREIAGGLQGRLKGRWLRLQRMPDRVISRLLRPHYYDLSRSGNIARLLPRRFRPQVVVFQVKGQDQFRLLLGQRVIGRYNERNHHWQIRRPFRLFVDERTLPKHQNMDLTGSE